MFVKDGFLSSLPWPLLLFETDAAMDFLWPFCCGLQYGTTEDLVLYIVFSCH